MISLFSMYLGIFLLLPVVSFVLPHLGTHLLAREKSIETLVLSVVSMSGLLVSGIIFEGEMSLIFSLMMIILIYLSVQKINKKKESFYILLFIIFTAINYWLITFFPFLETHFTRVFSGDIVTLSGNEFYLSLSIFVLLSGYLTIQRKNLFHETINTIIFKHKEKYDFTLVYLLALVTGCFTLGTLFTLALLFVVPIILGLKNRLSFYTYLPICCLLAAFSTIFGFSLSLYIPRMATVPTMVLILTLISLLTNIFLSNRFFKKA